MKWFHFLLLFCGAMKCHGGRVLFMVPFNGPSHWHYMSHFIRELLDRGHHLTAITSFKLKGNANPNYTEVLIDPPYDLSQLASDEDVFNVRFASPMKSIKWLYNLGILASDHGLASKAVQDLIKREDLAFDVVICEHFSHESFYTFAHKFKAPLITIATMGYADYMDSANGLVTPLAYCPNLFLNYDDRMTFVQRLENVLVTAYDHFIRQTWFYGEQDKLVKKYFASLPKPLPSVKILEHNMALLLVNTHDAISRPRPRMPNQINIGGAHINPKPESLPADIKSFMDEAEHGVVYMSLGAYVKSSKLPRDKMNAILEVFSRLQQRVIWKFESDDIPKLPANVLVRKWMPQPDILAHPKMRLFVTHGGIHGTYEGIWAGVPMLFMPFYGDQHRNAQKASNSGIALQVNFNDLTTETFHKKMKELLENPTYREKVSEMSEGFRDNSIPPMESAMYHIEYVMRYKGSKHLKSAASQLAWYEHMLLDLLGFFLVALIGTYFVFKAVLRALLGGLLQPRNPQVKLKAN